MIQQYVLLRKENDLLNSLIGQSFNQKSKFEAYKILTEIHSKAQDRSIGKMALCYIVDKNEILGVGGSSLMKDKNGKIFSNLILDQFGIWLAGMTGRRAGGVRLIALKSLNIGTVNLQTYTTTTNLYFNRTVIADRGFSVRVGSGSTPPVRTDFDIETAFGTAPESTFFVAVSDPVWNSGLGNFKYFAGITAGGAGTINESIGAYSWQTDGINNGVFTAFRDIISPAQSFIAGQTIALEYTVQL